MGFDNLFCFGSRGEKEFGQNNGTIRYYGEGDSRASTLRSSHTWEDKQAAKEAKEAKKAQRRKEAEIRRKIQYSGGPCQPVM